jgi:hypothetical protein
VEQLLPPNTGTDDPERLSHLSRNGRDEECLRGLDHVGERDRSATLPQFPKLLRDRRTLRNRREQFVA